MNIEELRDDDVEDGPFDHFLGEGFVTEVVRIIQTGKEASVHLCRANRSTIGEDLVALKLYHPLGRRDFRDESIYRDGEWIKERRIRAALEKKTRFGRHVQGALWVNREWDMLCALSAVGSPVPRPIANTDEAILMGFVGDEEKAAPQLHAHRPDEREARDLFEQLMRAIERMLYENVIHGDLSPYNVLVWDGRATRQLAQGGVVALLDRLRREYEFIIIDCSPVLPVVDPLQAGSPRKPQPEHPPGRTGPSPQQEPNPQHEIV